MEYKVVIPQWQDYYLKAKKTNPKYWLWAKREDLPKKYSEVLRRTPIIVGGKAFCCDQEGNRFVKNTKRVGTANTWVLNGNDLYSGTLHYRLRKQIAAFYHSYFSGYIKNQLKPIEFTPTTKLSISCDIYEIKRRLMPDIGNMWLLEKFFEDALQECGIIPDDSPDYVEESGRKRYHWVDSPEKRKLVFTIKEL